MNYMKITVLGCGALGQLWMSALDKAGHEVQGWLRVPQPLCRVNLIQTDGQAYQRSLPANDASLLAHSDILLVTLKAWQIYNALTPLLPRLHPTCRLVLLHNGMGSQHELPAFTQPVFHGVTTHAARRDGNAIRHVAAGITHIGPTNAAARPLSSIADTLHQALPDVAWHDDIMPAVWKKLAINCAINPLTVIYQCRNGDLQRHMAHVAQIAREVAEVMTAEGYHTTAETLFNDITNVIHTTADNYSSMYQDVAAQRHTEIDYITGYLLRRARKHGLHLPENIRVFDTIKRKEQDYERIGSGLPGAWQ